MKKSLYTNQQPVRTVEMASIQSMAKKLPDNQDGRKEDEKMDTTSKELNSPIQEQPKVSFENSLIDIVSTQLEEEDEKYSRSKNKSGEIMESKAYIEERQSSAPKKEDSRKFHNTAIEACMRSAKEMDEREKEEQEDQSILESRFEKKFNRYA